MTNIKNSFFSNLFFSKTKYLYLLVVSTCVIWYVIIFCKQELPPDVGDGVMHYFISQASWTNYSLFLDHWGKPLFILLSSPFSQFNYSGLFVFQLLVFIFTCFFAYRIYHKLIDKSFIIVLFPIFLTLTNDYNETILSGLTEPLFNLSIIISVFFFVNKKYKYFALIVSLLPFLRSEGQLCVLIAIIILIYIKQYFNIFYLLVGFLIYSIIGYFVLDDFWWYFTQSPYKYNNNIYGHGEWNHYLISYKNYIGNHGLFLFIIAFLFLFKVHNKFNKHEFVMYLYSLILFLGIIFAHSYFWANGKNGSMGLTRIATQGMPLFNLFNIIVVSKIRFNFIKFKTLINVVTIFLLVFLPLIFLFTNNNFPKKTGDLDSMIVEATNFLKVNKSYKKVFYNHPLIPFLFNVNPLIKNDKFFANNNIIINGKLNTKITNGDIYIYDSHFSFIDFGLNLRQIEHIKNFPIVGKFLTSNGYEISGVTIFQKQSFNNISIKTKSKIIFDTINISSKNEFYNLFKIKKNNIERKIIIYLKRNIYINVFAVCTDKKVENYQAVDLYNKDSVVFQIRKNKDYDLYFWNQTKDKFDVTLYQVKEFNYIYPKMTIE